MDLEYRTIYSAKRKKLTITVERDRSIVVHAPVGTTDLKVREIIEAKKLWLFEKTHHSQKYADLPHPPGKELVSGESMLYLGQEYRIELDDTADQVRFTQSRFIVPRRRAGERYSAFQDWYKARASEEILPRVDRFAQQLGVDYNKAQVVNGRYRWGSCTLKDNININWRLVKAPPHVIDYVVVHELAHLLEPNHTPRFWNIVRSQLSSVERAKAWLKDNGELLEQEI